MGKDLKVPAWRRPLRGQAVPEDVAAIDILRESLARGYVGDS